MDGGALPAPRRMDGAWRERERKRSEVFRLSPRLPRTPLACSRAGPAAFGFGRVARGRPGRRGVGPFPLAPRPFQARVHTPHPTPRISQWPAPRRRPLWRRSCAPKISSRRARPAPRLSPPPGPATWRSTCFARPRGCRPARSARRGRGPSCCRSGEARTTVSAGERARGWRQHWARGHARPPKKKSAAARPRGRPRPLPGPAPQLRPPTPPGGCWEGAPALQGGPGRCAPWARPPIWAGPRSLALFGFFCPAFDCVPSLPPPRAPRGACVARPGPPIPANGMSGSLPPAHGPHLAIGGAGRARRAGGHEEIIKKAPAKKKTRPARKVDAAADLVTHTLSSLTPLPPSLPRPQTSSRSPT